MTEYILRKGSRVLQVTAESEYHAIEEFKRVFKLKNNGNIIVTKV